MATTSETPLDAQPASGTAKKPSRALIKKLEARQQGLDLVEAALAELLVGGMGGLTNERLENLRQRGQQFADHFLPGMAVAWERVLSQVPLTDAGPYGKSSALPESELRAGRWRALLDLFELVKKGRETLRMRLADPGLRPDPSTDAEERLGQAWKLDELRDYGLCQANASLAQLAFHAWEDEAQDAWIYQGWWLELTQTKLVLTRHYRPRRAMHVVPGEDSRFMVHEAAELMVYPGAPNPRARWQNATERQPTPADWDRVRAAALPDLAAWHAWLKLAWKPLGAPAAPAALLSYQALLQSEAGPLLRDANGAMLRLTDLALGDGLATQTALQALAVDFSGPGVILLRAGQDLADDRLLGQALGLLVGETWVRLAG
jgi:hypothetical protein